MRGSSSWSRCLVTFLALVAILLMLVGAAPDSGSAGAREQLTERLLAFGQAFRQADADRLKEMLAERYVHTNGSSAPLDKQAWLNWVASRRNRVLSGELVYDRYELEDLALEVYTDMAVVTGLVVTRGTDGASVFSRRIRVTQVWVLEEGEWKRAAFHDTAVPT